MDNLEITYPKKDDESFAKIYCIDDFGSHTEYLFDKCSGIDCFHRLKLSTNDLNLLYKIGKMQNKSKKYIDENIDETWTEIEATTYDGLLDKEKLLWDELYRSFENPFDLEIERNYDFSNISFCFSDEDYMYDVTHYKNGWRVSCRIAFYQQMDEPYVDMDSPVR